MSDMTPMAPKRRHKNAPKRPRGPTLLWALRLTDPAAWAKRIKDAMIENEGRVDEAAETLGISRRQLFRLLSDPMLAEVERAPRGGGGHRN